MAEEDSTAFSRFGPLWFVRFDPLCLSFEWKLKWFRLIYRDVLTDDFVEVPSHWRWRGSGSVSGSECNCCF